MPHDVILTEAERETALTTPSDALIRQMKGMAGTLMIVGAGGKMGPTLAVLAARAVAASGSKLKIIAVSRFSDPAQKEWLQARNISTISADLLDDGDVKELPDADFVVSLAGKKFGTSVDPSETWAVNCLASASVCKRFRGSSIVALSTGNVYPVAPLNSGGSNEDDALIATGEYSAAAIGRERVLQYFATHQGVKIAIVRLNYAVDMVYGVLMDIGRKVMEGEPIDLQMGYLNCIWQGDANEAVLRLLPYVQSPANVYNLSGPLLSVKKIALEFGDHLKIAPQFSGVEKNGALLTNSSKLNRLLGEPTTPISTVIKWTAQWLKNNGRSLGKPTKFEVSDGKY
jgi:nucleoside-diphosphate-sugar epimerase